MINQLLKFLNFLLILIGCFVVSWIIWVRFIRERVPKDIPYELTDYRFCFITYLIFIYIIIILSLLFTQKKEQNIFFKSFIKFLYKPLEMFDEFIKQKIVPKFSLKIYNVFLTKILYEMKTHHMKECYITLYIIPRSILVIVFLSDVFIFMKLFYIYKIIYLSMLPLLHRYLKYSLKKVKTDLLEILKSIYKVVMVPFFDKEGLEDTNYTFINVKDIELGDFLDQYTCEGIIRGIYSKDLDFEGNVCCHQKRYDDYKNRKNIEELAPEHYRILKISFKGIFPKLVDLNIFLERYSQMENNSYIFTKIKLKNIKILIFFCYFLGWNYILFRSLGTIKDDTYVYYIMKVIVEKYNISIEPSEEGSIDIEDVLNPNVQGNISSIND